MQFAADAPNRVECKKRELGWWEWLWGQGEEQEEEMEEILVLGMQDEPRWLRQLSPEEKEKLYHAIGYDANENIKHDPDVSNGVTIIQLSL